MYEFDGWGREGLSERDWNASACHPERQRRMTKGRAGTAHMGKAVDKHQDSAGTYSPCQRRSRSL
ncbi:MAG: hypothetical protein ACXWPG_11840 [Ktedonobacteraceae bacterium]